MLFCLCHHLQNLITHVSNGFMVQKQQAYPGVGQDTTRPTQRLAASVSATPHMCNANSVATAGRT
jgi:hypothetical protein